MRQHSHAVVRDTRQLAEHGADPLGTLRHLDVQQLLDSTREAELVDHHRTVVKTVKVRQCLLIRLVLDQLFSTAVQQTDVRLRLDGTRNDAHQHAESLRRSAP